MPIKTSPPSRLPTPTCGSTSSPTTTPVSPAPGGPGPGLRGARDRRSGSHPVPGGRTHRRPRQCRRPRGRPLQLAKQPGRRTCARLRVIVRRHPGWRPTPCGAARSAWAATTPPAPLSWRPRLVGHPAHAPTASRRCADSPPPRSRSRPPGSRVLVEALACRRAPGPERSRRLSKPSGHFICQQHPVTHPVTRPGRISADNASPRRHDRVHRALADPGAGGAGPGLGPERERARCARSFRMTSSRAAWRSAAAGPHNAGMPAHQWRRIIVHTAPPTREMSWGPAWRFRAERWGRTDVVAPERTATGPSR